MIEKTAFILALFLFCFVHSGLATTKVKTFLQALIPFRYYRLFYNAVSFLLLFPVFFIYHLAEPYWFWEPKWYSTLPGILLLILSFYLWSKTFDNYSLAEFVGTDRLKKHYKEVPELKLGGLNRWVRHPLYSISYFFLAGLFLLFPNDLILLTALGVIIYFPIGIYYEELKMEKLFGEQYKSYKATTPKLFPRWSSIIKTL